MNAMLTLLLAVTAASAAPAKAPEAPGQATFAKKCSACHGKDGKGSKMMAKMFKTELENLDLVSEAAQKKTDAELTETIHKGKNKMPSFKGKLKDAEITEVLSYVRAFAPKKADADKK